MHLPHILLAISSIYLPSAYGVTSCDECTDGSTCIIQDLSSTFSGGGNKLRMKVCNFDSDKADFRFSVAPSVSCGDEDINMPSVDSAEAVGDCDEAACEVVVTFDDPIDWALALNPSGEGASPRLLQAKVGDGDAVVQIAHTYAENAGAEVSASEDEELSICAVEAKIKGSKLSFNSKCNAVASCQGSNDTSSCSGDSLLGDWTSIKDVECDKEACKGVIAIGNGMPCDAYQGDNSKLVAAVTVADSVQSNFAPVAQLVKPSTNILSVEGMDVGSSSFVLETDASCPAADVRVNVSTSDGQALEVDGQDDNYGVLNVTLASPLDEKYVDQELSYVVAQCGVDGTAVQALVGEDMVIGEGNSSSLEGDRSVSSHLISNNSKDSSASATQESDSNAGLSGGVYVGIAIGVVALIGFIFECLRHKRQHPRANSQEAIPATANSSEIPEGHYAI